MISVGQMNFLFSPGAFDQDISSERCGADLVAQTAQLPEVVGSNLLCSNKLVPGVYDP